MKLNTPALETLKGVLSNSETYTKVFSALNDDTFHDTGLEDVWNVAKSLSREEIQPTLKNIWSEFSRKNHEATHDEFKNKLKQINESSTFEDLFFLSRTVEFVKNKNIYASVMKIATDLDKNIVPEYASAMLEQALQVDFDKSTGLRYNDTIEERHDYYTSPASFTPTGFTELDDVLGGGLRKKSLMLFASPTHGGKSAAKAWLASQMLKQGKNVLFITLEISEMETAKRIDASLMNSTEMNDFSDMSLEQLKSQVPDVEGSLIIKEYGAGSLNTLMIKSLLQDLKAQDFVPEFIMVDYLGLMVSHRQISGAESYESLGKVAEDLHGLAKETNTCVVSSQQLNRSAYGNLEAGNEAISESLKILMTSDVACLLLSNDNMKAQGTQVWKFTKNRWSGALSSLNVSVNFGTVQYSAGPEDMSGPQQSEGVKPDVDKDLFAF